MISFPTKKPRCPVCGKGSKIVSTSVTSVCGDSLDYESEEVTIRCAKDGIFEVMKAVRP